MRPRRTFFRCITNSSFLRVDALLVVDVAVRVREGDRLRAELQQFLDRCTARRCRCPTRGRLLPASDWLRVASISAGEIHGAVSGRFRPNQRPAPVQSLAGEHAGESHCAAACIARKRNPISRPPTPMSPAGTSVFGPMWRHSSVMKLWQKRITSLSLLPFGIEVRPAFAAAHRQRRQRILEHLLEGEKLEDAEVDATDESAGRLVRARSRCSSRCGSRD